MCASSSGFDMSTFIRRYSRYLNEKSFAYRQMSFDFVRVKKGYAFLFHAAQLLTGVYTRLNNSGVPVVCGMDPGVFVVPVNGFAEDGAAECCFTGRQKVTLALKNTKRQKTESRLDSPVRLQTDVLAGRRCVGVDPSETSHPFCLRLCQS